MPEPPSGTVTFLLTDIEGSTRLWEQHPEEMKAAVTRHDALAAQVIATHAGSLVKGRGEGDSLFAVFARATDAVGAAAALQLALLAEAWPTPTPLRVRMALHTGEADFREGDYYGAVVNRCARLRATAHGGQVLLSLATKELVRPRLPEGAGLKDLGQRRLRDLAQPEHVYQLLHPDLPADFPPLRSLDELPNNLPQQATSFVGREQVMAEVKRLLEKTRLLTLTGSGGTGKTRLSLQVATEVLEEYEDGVWLVELAPISEPVLVPQAVATVLGIKEEPGKPLTQTLVDALKPKHRLLLLDNCEHLLAACADLADAVLRGCPKVRILASSREGLNISGELTYPIPSLSLPDARKLPPVESLTKYEAVRLFIERAGFSQPGFTLTYQNAPAVAHVCCRLDGLPLAIELAAARVKTLPIEKLSERLDDRFRLLTGGSRTALPRQQTLRATIDWSYELLSEPERLLLQRLCVFAGGWTLEAAEAVCAGERVPAWEVLDLLTGLVEKSLVMYEEHQGRYRLLETVGQYASDRLSESGEGETWRDRHLDYFLALAEQEVPEMGSHRSRVDRLELEHDNVRAALAWSGTPGREEVGLRLGAAFWPFWYRRSYLGEGREHLETLLALPGAASRTALRTWVLHGAGALAEAQGHDRAARERFEESLASFRELGDQRGIAAALLRGGWLAHWQGDYRTARECFEGMLAIFRELGDREGIGTALHDLGWVARWQGDWDAARALLEEGLGIHREVGDTYHIGWSLNGLGELSIEQEDYRDAQERFEESLATFRQIGDRMGICSVLERLAVVAAAQGQSRRAAYLFAAAMGLRETMGAHRLPLVSARRDGSIAAVRTLLGEEAFAAAWAEGRAMPVEQAIGYALEEKGP